jgi:hypothetical protein
MLRQDASSVRPKREKKADVAVPSDRERSVTEQYAIAGRAALDHAGKNPGFKEELTRALDAELTKSQERKLIGLTLSNTGRGANKRLPPED